MIQAIDFRRSIACGAKPLAGGALKGELSGLRRLRVGDYRIVYEAVQEQLLVLVVRIGHRREVYR